MYHFYIYLDVHDGYKKSSNSLKIWADYLFFTLEKSLKKLDSMWYRRTSFE